MIQREVNINCEDVESFYIEFEDDNYYGITTDQELFNRWLRDLRSGKYTQLRNELYSSENELSYCALGVLCKKRIKRWLQSATPNKELDTDDIIGDIIDHRSDYFTPITIIADNGFKYNIIDFLMELNDQCKLSFMVIADIMETIHKTIRGENTDKLVSTLSKNNNWKLFAI